jgi:hypothetical protein
MEMSVLKEGISDLSRIHSRAAPKCCGRSLGGRCFERLHRRKVLHSIHHLLGIKDYVFQNTQ